MRKYLLVLFVLGFLVGCSSKEAIEEAETTEQAQQDTVVAQEEGKPAEAVVEQEAVVETKVEKETVPEKAVVEQEAVVETKAEIETVPEKVVEKKATPISMSDSVNVIYMTRPGDYLTKIALNEYGRASVWRMIWNWNYEKIGDNPDIIFPFQEYDLKKPREVAKPVKYDLYDYTVAQGETLWSIAEKEYGNNYAWVVILRDNYDKLGNEYNTLKPGTVLQLRTKLY